MNRSQRSFPIACAAFIAVSGKGAVLVNQKRMNKASVSFERSRFHAARSSCRER